MNTKKRFVLMLVIVMLISLFATVLTACGDKKGDTNSSSPSISADKSNPSDDDETSGGKIDSGTTDKNGTTTNDQCVNGHTSATAVKENVIEATCEQDGSYDEVVYCSVCKKELSREKIVVTGGHNFVEGKCEKCGESQYTQSLIYTLSSDGNSYIVTGIENRDDVCYIGIPSTYNEKPVTSIGSLAFYNCSGLTSITIPDSVTSIGSAFYGCSGLTSITIPDSVKTIGPSAFYECSSLTSVTFGNGLTTIGGNAFGKCSGLQSIIIPDGVTSIGDWAFNDCSGLTNVTIPGSVKSIAFSAFSDCSELTSVTLGNGLTTICENAFSECTRLQSIVIPDGVTSIGDWAFIYCRSLTNVTIPDSVTSIGENAFYGCENFAFNEYDNAYYLGNETNPYVLLMKAKNKKITSCEINENAKAIYDMAFSGCFELTSVTIPANVIHIGSAAFFVCGKLTNLTVANGNSVYHSEGDCIIETETKTLVLGCQNSVIPDDGSVTIIGEFAFCGCSGLTSIAIPDSVTIIGECAFYGCRELQSVTIPANVTKIDCRAFEDCLSLTSITIPANVTEIGLRTFFNCHDLTSIEFEDTTTWYRTTDLIDWQNNTDGTEISVEDSFANVNEFNSIDYYWYKL